MADSPSHQQQHNDDPEREKKRKKALRRMSKIVAKAWELDNAEPFQTYNGKGKHSILCLTALGRKVDEEGYGFGRHGWVDFAKDIGGIYNRHVQRYARLCVNPFFVVPSMMGFVCHRWFV
jgi:hypothetical protein